MPHFLVLPHPLSLKSCLKSYKVPYKHHKYNLTHTPGYHQSSTCLQDFMDIKKSSLPFIPWLPLIPTLKLACQCCHQVGVGGTWFPTTADKAYHLRHVSVMSTCKDQSELSSRQFFLCLPWCWPPSKQPWRMVLHKVSCQVTQSTQTGLS